MSLKVNPASYVAIDFETADYQPDSACAIGLSKVCGGEIVDSFYSLIRPPRQRVCFTHVHGLTWNMLKDSPNFADLWPDIFNFLHDASYFVAHNASFDRRVLLGCCASVNIAVPKQPFRCSLKGARSVFSLKSNSLDAVCAHLNIDLKHHHAGEDARAAAQIWLELLQRGYTFS